MRNIDNNAITGTLVLLFIEYLCICNDLVSAYSLITFGHIVQRDVLFKQFGVLVVERM